MSNLNPEIDYSGLPNTLRFVVEQWIKSLNACLPGIITSYDSTTRRATVQPALDTLTTDGRRVEPPPIANVPIVWPSGGGYTLVLPLRVGDPVLLVFSQRGLTKFKQSYGRSIPDEDSLFDLRDAIAIPGFGPPPSNPITSVSTTGITLQANDGASYITVEPDGIRIKTTGRVSLTDSTGTKDL